MVSKLVDFAKDQFMHALIICTFAQVPPHPKNHKCDREKNFWTSFEKLFLNEPPRELDSVGLDLHSLFPDHTLVFVPQIYTVCPERSNFCLH